MPSLSVLELDDASLEPFLSQKERPLMVMFYTPDCPHCHVMDPYFEQYAAEFKGKVDFAKIDIAQNQQIMLKYGIRGTPTFTFFCEGRPVHAVAGEMYPTLVRKFVEDSLQSSPQCAENTTWIDVGITGYA